MGSWAFRHRRGRRSRRPRPSRRLAALRNCRSRAAAQVDRLVGDGDFALARRAGRGLPSKYEKSSIAERAAQERDSLVRARLAGCQRIRRRAAPTG